ncbi:MAG: DUF5615 family PIN-like protein [Chloroflexi bacterium]|nr:DUF5615 family PIN-like protein [Ardenticatenaceae bacterium]MBL1127150.1 hypothetical protein [Chloroflexota bacterium]NOG33209.1 DUF5615 family PIN-like protein [Chloroflexota bacterium]GIK55005.1 MAG: hypothetical protein BroJett015_06680 [Chloroflexota bacterium]
MARLYSNENFPLPVVESLRQSGHDVLTIQETGLAAKATPDEQVLAFAIKEDRILLTFNRKHFIQPHRKTPAHAGIIICTYDPDFAALAQRIHQEISQHTDFSGLLLRVNRPHRV